MNEPEVAWAHEHAHATRRSRLPPECRRAERGESSRRPEKDHAQKAMHARVHATMKYLPPFTRTGDDDFALRSWCWADQRLHVNNYLLYDDDSSDTYNLDHYTRQILVSYPPYVRADDRCIYIHIHIYCHM
jgi:hypothetical protein